MNSARWTRVLPCFALAASLLGTWVARAANAVPGATQWRSDGSIFVQLEIPKREFYVGESVPVVIQVGAQDDVVASLDNPPSVRGDAFTLNMLTSEPDRERRVIDGKPFTLLAWHSLLAAVKPGALSLTVEAPLTVRVPKPQPDPNFADESAAGDPLSDPAFESLLQSTTEQAIVASSPSMAFYVLALPVRDRPPGFSGAVGSFKISSELSRNRTAVGEPLTLTMRVVGTGNFDRVNSAMLGAVKDWKIYRPAVKFTPAENTGYRGEKLFEQPVAATHAGSHRLPGLEFSYFDPETGHYEVARAAPLDIDVDPGAADAGLADSQLSSSHPLQRGNPSHAATGQSHELRVRGDHVDPGSTTQSLVPLYLRPPFLSAPVLLIFAFTVIWFKRSHPMPRTDRHASYRSDAVTADLLSAMERAAEAGDGMVFFDAASRALIGAGAVRCSPADSGLDDDLREILRLTDVANYAGEKNNAADLQRCRRIVLRHLEPPCTARRSAAQRVTD